jgi:hypothetical protein
MSNNPGQQRGPSAQVGEASRGKFQHHSLENCVSMFPCLAELGWWRQRMGVGFEVRLKETLPRPQGGIAQVRGRDPALGAFGQGGEAESNVGHGMTRARERGREGERRSGSGWSAPASTRRPPALLVLASCSRSSSRSPCRAAAATPGHRCFFIIVHRISRCVDSKAEGAATANRETHGEEE